MTLSLAMIVKNEEKTLERVLRSAMRVSDEIIVVDTGSSDKTIEIARSFGASVLSFEWINDFSAARNFSFSQCTSDWILWLDADDVLPENSQRIIEALKEGELSDEIDAVVATYNYFYDETGRCTSAFPRERLLRRAAGLRWKFPIHENIVYDTRRALKRPDLIVEHRAELALYPQKIERNFRIIEQEVLTGNSDPQATFNYAMQLVRLKEWEKSVRYFRQFLEQEPKSQYAYDALIRISMGLEAQTQIPQAIEAAFKALKLNGARAEAFVRIGHLNMQGKLWDQAIPFFRAATSIQKPSVPFTIDADYTYRPWDGLSICYERVGDIERALECSLQAARYPYDQDRILKNVSLFLQKLAKRIA